MDASGASSSSAADPINSSSYGVFINHRGPDTKKTFAIPLYRRLFERGLKPFLDQEELKVGFNFPSQILGAIRSARVHVAIFSPTYAHSQWCLDELSLMLESGAPIIPIFFQVDPADLRWTDQKKKGVYAKALNELQRKTRDDLQTDEKKPRYDSATLQKWRKALSDVADISGFDLKGKFNGNWLKTALALCPDVEVAGFRLDCMEDEVNFLEKMLSGESESIGFCHNDLQYANMMFNDEDKWLTIIDYDCAHYDPVAFDIANHFNEMAAILIVLIIIL